MSDFKWNDELAKEFCEYAVLHIGKSVDSLLVEDFKKSKLPELTNVIYRDWEVLERFPYGANDGDISPIKTVKRLSDGEVFTVGDTFTLFGGNNHYKIYSFSVDGNILMAHQSNYFNCEKRVPLPHLIKIKHKQPLFHTEDGVYIWSWYDVVWVVNSAWYMYSSQAASYDVENLPYNKYFSTKEKAEEYVLMNNTCLSLNDLLGVRDENGANIMGRQPAMFTMFKQIVKSKLNIK